MRDFSKERIRQAEDESGFIMEPSGLAGFVEANGNSLDVDAEIERAMIARWNACADALAVLDGPAGGTVGAFGTARRLLYTAVHGEG